MIYRRYGANAENVLASSFVYGFELIGYAQEQEIEDKMFLRWVVAYQNQMTFIDFKNQLKQQSITDSRTSDEILSEVDSIMERFEWNFSN